MSHVHPRAFELDRVLKERKQGREQRTSAFQARPATAYRSRVNNGKYPRSSPAPPQALGASSRCIVDWTKLDVLLHFRRHEDIPEERFPELSHKFIASRPRTAPLHPSKTTASATHLLHKCEKAQRDLGILTTPNLPSNTARALQHPLLMQKNSLTKNLEGFDPTQVAEEVDLKRRLIKESVSPVYQLSTAKVNHALKRRTKRRKQKPRKPAPERKTKPVIPPPTATSPTSKHESGADPELRLKELWMNALEIEPAKKTNKRLQNSDKSRKPKHKSKAKTKSRNPKHKSKLKQTEKPEVKSKRSDNEIDERQWYEPDVQLFPGFPKPTMVKRACDKRFVQSDDEDEGLAPSDSITNLCAGLSLHVKQLPA